MSAKLEVMIRLTGSDGLPKENSGVYEFSTDEEAADHYWAILGGASIGSMEKEKESRGKGKK